MKTKFTPSDISEVLVCYEPEAQEFAQMMVDSYRPAECFVIDVALTDNRWKIVEINCINCAGFYKGDLMKVIGALENFYGREKYNPIDGGDMKW